MQRVTRDQLRDHLDEYRDAAELGETIEIGDKGHAVSTLAPPREPPGSEDVQAILRGVKERLAKLPPVDVDVVAMLREDRDRR